MENDMKSTVRELASAVSTAGGSGDILLLSSAAGAWANGPADGRLDVAWLGTPEQAWADAVAATGISVTPQLLQAMGRPDLSGVAGRSETVWAEGHVRVLLPAWEDLLACLVLGRRELDVPLIAALTREHGLASPWDVLDTVRGRVPAPYGRAGAQDAFLKRHVFSLEGGSVRLRAGRPTTLPALRDAVKTLHVRVAALVPPDGSLGLPELQEPLGDFAEALKVSSYEEREGMLNSRPRMDRSTPEADAIVAGLVREAARQGGVPLPSWTFDVTPLARPLVLLGGDSPNPTLLAMNVVIDGDAGLNKE